MTITVAALHRYPVKGLSPEPLAEARLEEGAYFPGDRLFAIENSPSGFDPAEPRHQPKIKFLMLMRNERLASLRTRYLDDTDTLVVTEGGGERVRARLGTAEGRDEVRRFFEAFIGSGMRGPADVLAAPDGFRFTDSRSGYVSLLNLASVADLEGRIDAPVDPLRFRANIHLDGLPAWQEFEWVGRKVMVGDAMLEITKRIVRCAATEVDPTTGIRDLPIPRSLDKFYDHTDCGVYARVIRAGSIRPGDTVEVEDAVSPRPDAQTSLPAA